MDVKAQCDQPVIGLFGPSGAGKSTLLHGVSGTLKPDYGFLRMGDQPWFDSEKGIFVKPYQRGVGMVFQDGRLFPHLTVMENLKYGKPFREEGPSLDQIIDLLELEPLLEKRPFSLSGGQAQRVALGRALACRPRVLLMDEPLAALDRGLKIKILPFLRRIFQRFSIPTIYVSHDLSEILSLTRDLLILKNGSILAQGSFDQILNTVEVLEVVHDLGLDNVFPALVELDSGVGGRVGYRPEKGPLIFGPANGVKHGEQVVIGIRPEDISLVKHPVEGISIQNQLKGRLVGTILGEKRAFCRIDVGIPLLAEITLAAAGELGLNPGDDLYCMFKAHAVRRV